MNRFNILKDKHATSMLGVRVFSLSSCAAAYLLTLDTKP